MQRAPACHTYGTGRGQEHRPKRSARGKGEQGRADHPNAESRHAIADSRGIARYRSRTRGQTFTTNAVTATSCAMADIDKARCVL
jgi:hypothetical protein